MGKTIVICFWALLLFLLTYDLRRVLDNIACQKIVKISQCFTELFKNKSGIFVRHIV